jgi:hypothetical protein
MIFGIYDSLIGMSSGYNGLPDALGGCAVLTPGGVQTRCFGPLLLD